MSKSVMSNEKRCLICGTTANLHRHHIFHGTANRKKSEEHGCWCWLCANHHNMSPAGVHNDAEFDLNLKKTCQTELMLRHGWSREKFREVFGKSYL